MNEHMTVLSSEKFDEFICSTTCLVMLFKPNCPHCKILKTVVDKVLPSYPNLVLAGIDSIASPDLMTKLKTDRVPSLLFFKNGEISTKKSGIMNPKEMSIFISGALNT